MEYTAAGALRRGRRRVDPGIDQGRQSRSRDRPGCRTGWRPRDPAGTVAKGMAGPADAGPAGWRGSALVDLVGDLELAEFDIAEAGLGGDVYHERLAAAREHGWLVKSPIAYVVLDREAGEFFLRARQTAFPGREIAELCGITGGRLAEQIDANILNLTGDRHRRLRALVAPAFTPRAAARWRPAMREIARSLWQDLDGRASCPFVPG